VTFGAFYQPQKVADLEAASLAQWPQVIAGDIVPVINLDGVKPGELTLDAIAKIFLAEIDELGIMAGESRTSGGRS
jgi:phosphate transport system substrate-binding protein